MSALAEFIRLPVSAVDALRSHFGETVEKEGRPAVEFDWSGHVLVTLLPYLAECGINLMESPYKAIARQLSESRRASIFIFTPEHRKAFHDKLAPDLFSSDDLGEYFSDFNGRDEPGIGVAMLDGIAAIQKSLAALDAKSVILLSIG